MQSILDNDLYKFSMQQAVWKLYPTAQVKYEFKNRSPNIHRYTREAFDKLQKRFAEFDNLVLSDDECDWLKSRCPYFTDGYLLYLKSFRFQSKKQIKASFDEESGQLAVSIHGLWLETILYEVPVLALISETYFDTVDLDWSIDGQREIAMQKCKTLIENGCVFTDFGTRRRRSHAVHDVVVGAFSQVAAQMNQDGPVRFVGTSNVFLAKKYNLKPIGTVAHEWFMAISVLEGDLLHANRNAIEKWIEAYPNHLHVALTDTYGSAAFFADLDVELATKLDGIRQDSGSPLRFIDQAMDHYKKLKIDPSTKAIVFSDSLDVQKCIEIKDYLAARNGPKAQFGIGTHFTNDFKTASGKNPSKAMNIVIKLSECNGKFVVKLSDDQGKHQGNSEAVKEALRVFGFE